MDFKFLIELLGSQKDKIVEFFRDLPNFVLRPRRFLAKMVEEPPELLLYRLMVYVTTFVLVELVAFSSTGRSPIVTSPFDFAGMIIYESAFSLFLLPPILVAALASGAKRPLKTALAYCIAFRLVFYAPVVLLSGLFLVTEEYSVAFIRGIVLWASLLAYLMVFPLSVGEGRSIRRVLSSLTCLLAFILMVGVTGYVRSEFWTESSRLDHFSLLYDPIAGEVFDLGGMERFGSAAAQELPEIKNAYRLRCDSTSLAVDWNPSWVAAWRGRSAMLKVQWPREIKRLKEKRNSCLFNTTKRFIDFRIRELEDGLDLAQRLDVLTAQPTVEGISSFYDSQIQHYDWLNDAMESVYEFKTTYWRLVELGLLL